MIAVDPDEFIALGESPRYPACSQCSLHAVLFGHEVCTGIGMVFVPAGRPMYMVGLVTTIEARASDSACGPEGRMFIPELPEPLEVAAKAPEEPWYRRFWR